MPLSCLPLLLNIAAILSCSWRFSSPAIHSYEPSPEDGHLSHPFLTNSAKILANLLGALTQDLKSQLQVLQMSEGVAPSPLSLGTVHSFSPTPHPMNI